MNRLEKILSEHIEGGPGAWKKLYDDIEQYTSQCIKLSLDKAAENATMNWHCGHFKTDTPTQYHQVGGDNLQVNKQSITNENNIVLL